MILGIGIDVIEISRIARAADKAGFLQRVFTEGERTYFAPATIIRKT